MYRPIALFSIFLLPLMGFIPSVSLAAPEQAPTTYSVLHLELGKMNALILDDIRLVLLQDGDLVATTRATNSGRALYSATGTYQGLARSGVNNWLLYNQEHQLTSTAHTTNITLQASTASESSGSPFSIFKKTSAATNTTVKAVVILDVSGNLKGTIHSREDTFQYYDSQNDLLGLAEKRDDGTLVLQPLEDTEKRTRP